MTKTDW